MKKILVFILLLVSLFFVYNYYGIYSNKSKGYSLQLLRLNKQENIDSKKIESLVEERRLNRRIESLLKYLMWIHFLLILGIPVIHKVFPSLRRVSPKN